MKIHNKLIRDRIPEIIVARGQKANIRTLTDEEFGKALLAKLVEEAKETEAEPEAAPAEKSENTSKPAKAEQPRKGKK